MFGPFDNLLDVVTKEEANNVMQLKGALKRLLDGVSHVVIHLDEIDVQFTYQVSPSIFMNISGDGKIILLEKFQCNTGDFDDIPCSSTPFKSNSYSERAGSSDLDFTGSPLKCDFLPLNDSIKLCDDPFLQNKNILKEQKSGFHLNFARALCFEMKSALEDLDLAELHSPILIACDGSDYLRTTFVGISCQMTKKFILVNSQSTFTKSEDFPCINNISSNMCFGIHSDMVDCNVEASYEVLANEDGNGSIMELVSSWKRPHSVFSPPNLDASTVLVMNIVLSDSRSPLFKLYLEMEILKTLISGLSSAKMTWITENSQFNLDKALDNLFDDLAKDYSNENEAYSLDEMIKNDFHAIRSNADFTDMVWTTLKYCGSYETLRFGLIRIFEAISSGIIRPRFLFKSKTQVGAIARSLMSGQAEIPEFDACMPLSMLIEIGLEKLKRDYISIFQVGSLATSDAISCFIEWDTSKDYQTYLGNLRMMHIALQAAVLMNHHLQLPHPIIVQSVSQVFTELSKNDSCVKFSFSLHTSLVDKIYRRLLIKSWNLHLKVKENEIDINLFLSKDPFNILTFPICSNCEFEKEEESSNSLFVSTALVVPSSFKGVF